MALGVHFFYECRDPFCTKCIIPRTILTAFIHPLINNPVTIYYDTRRIIQPLCDRTEFIIYLPRRKLEEHEWRNLQIALGQKKDINGGEALVVDIQPENMIGGFNHLIKLFSFGVEVNLSDYLFRLSEMQQLAEAIACANPNSKVNLISGFDPEFYDIIASQPRISIKYLFIGSVELGLPLAIRLADLLRHPSSNLTAMEIHLEESNIFLPNFVSQLAGRGTNLTSLTLHCEDRNSMFNAAKQLAPLKEFITPLQSIQLFCDEIGGEEETCKAIVEASRSNRAVATLLSCGKGHNLGRVGPHLYKEALRMLRE